MIVQSWLQRQFLRGSSLCLVAGIGLAMASASVGMAQQGGSKRAPSQRVSLTTDDGVLLSATYFPATPESKKGEEPDPDAGKSVAPVILVHGWGGKASELYPLARFLQQTHRIAVIVPELRGHGDSDRQLVRGVETKLDHERMKPPQIAQSILDIQACKRFLLEENNDKKVNIEMLSVIGVGFGAGLAVNWAAYDWSAPMLRTRKQGHDVKALILLSPKTTHRGVSTRTATRHPALRSTIAVQILVGTDAPSYKDASKLYRTLHRAKEDRTPPRVVLIKFDTKLEGVRLLSSPLGRQVANHMTRFLTAHIFKRAPQLPWQERHVKKRNE